MGQDWNRARFIFICSGNICRSPMAQGLMGRLFVDRGFRPALISMGTLGIIGRPASKHAITAVREVGVDISQHRSQGLNATLLMAADINFVMEKHHARAIAQTAPKAKVKLLSDFIPKLDGVWDPVGGPIEEFRESRDLIQRCLEAWMDSAGVPKG